MNQALLTLVSFTGVSCIHVFQQDYDFRSSKKYFDIQVFICFVAQQQGSKVSIRCNILLVLAENSQHPICNIFIDISRIYHQKWNIIQFMKCPIQASAQNIKKSCMALTNTEPNNCCLCSWSVQIKNYCCVASAWWKSDCSNCQRLSRFQKMTFNVAENWREEKPLETIDQGKNVTRQMKVFFAFLQTSKKNIFLKILFKVSSRTFFIWEYERDRLSINDQVGWDSDFKIDSLLSF